MFLEQENTKKTGVNFNKTPQKLGSLAEMPVFVTKE